MESGSPASQRVLRLLDVIFHLETDRPETFSILHKLFLTPEFDSPVEQAAIHARFHLDTESDGGCRVEVNGRFTPLGPCDEAANLVSEWVFLRFLQETRRFALVHAAAVAHHGRGILIVGSPQAGKTTLAVALAEHGLEYYSDDVAPLDRTDGTLHPFRKAAAVRLPGGGRDYRHPGLRSSAVQSSPPAPCPVGWVFLLEPRSKEEGGIPPTSPRIEQLPRDQAALALLQHTLNRLAGGRLALSYGDHPHLKLYEDIFAALSVAHCYRVTAVQPEATALALVKMIDDHVDGSALPQEHRSVGSQR